MSTVKTTSLSEVGSGETTCCWGLLESDSRAEYGGEVTSVAVVLGSSAILSEISNFAGQKSAIKTGTDDRTRRSLHPADLNIQVCSRSLKMRFSLDGSNTSFHFVSRYARPVEFLVTRGVTSYMWRFN